MAVQLWSAASSVVTGFSPVFGAVRTNAAEPSAEDDEEETVKDTPVPAVTAVSADRTVSRISDEASPSVSVSAVTDVTTLARTADTLPSSA